MSKNTTNPASGGGGNPAGGATTKCLACQIKISPKSIKLCGANKTAALTATGTPAGGTFAWTSSDAAVASVTGNKNKATVKGLTAGTTNIEVTYSPAGCGPCKDTVVAKVCTCTPKAGGGRYYTHAGPKSVADLIGAKAKIKTRYGKVCCEDEGCSTVDAYHVVYANVSFNGTGKMKWAQTGWGRERTPGATAIKKYRYAEMNGSVYKVNYDTAHAPAEGSTHEYKCELDNKTGKWTFSYDGTAWEHFTNAAWKKAVGTDAQWTGEIYNKEDDMPGTTADKCSFTECQYCVSGASFVDAGLVASDVSSDDSTEWGADFVSATAFDIWDKKPLP